MAAALGSKLPTTNVTADSHRETPTLGANRIDENGAMYAADEKVFFVIGALIIVKFINWYDANWTQSFTCSIRENSLTNQNDICMAT